MLVRFRFFVYVHGGLDAAKKRLGYAVFPEDLRRRGDFSDGKVRKNRAAPAFREDFPCVANRKRRLRTWNLVHRR